jgi:hypothetical protein
LYNYLILLYFQVTSDQPDFFCFARKMARLAAPHMKIRQEGPMPKHLTTRVTTQKAQVTTQT